MMFGATVLTCAEMRALESQAIASGGVSAESLMERAGAGAAHAIRRRFPQARTAVVLCGPGNNGGDGFVVARHLGAMGLTVRVGAWGTPETLPEPARTMCDRWRALGPVQPLDTAFLTDRDFPPDIVVDAIFGIGLSRPAQGELAAVLEETTFLRTGTWGKHAPGIVSLDCPSGLNLDTGFPLQPGQPFMGAAAIPLPELTVTFHSLKPGHLIGDGPEYCGDVEVIDIGLAGIGRTIRVETPCIPALSKRQGHKFTHGHALVVAGCIGRGGAARLAARAALRVGAGLVTLAPPNSALPEHSGPPDALMRRGVDDPAALDAILEDRRINAVCLGPGAGVERAAGLLAALIASGRACVLDADALTAMAEKPARLHDRCILTPHVKEFARLFPDLAAQLAPQPAGRPALSRLDAAGQAAERCGAIVLLKGPDTVIAAPDGQLRIHSAFDVPWLATAGTGDVLAGIIAGLLARGLAPLDAASTGAWLHAAAARRFGPGLIADDLPDTLPAVFRDLGL
ncbi:yjeF C-terminal region, hydroxyethylthiazole kinase-related/yjeF N-terminal region [Paracoccus alkenifer]|uniref:Bifunctional NAD(P)H-hydrate repair enzyme n=2 Tax=Paracoccus alkenifer TaxID=65735 RepID=A0A1H6KGI3_9RHOB|nr:NAD(P)H-hydrate dehydratase [Paracoccus alkenifer]SEH70607.1 yjeF C-terminal region, hydroxyethylthiazole kinase-related/yjeF N-terminal region [Paracoccus alkenifer]